MENKIKNNLITLKEINRVYEDKKIFGILKTAIYIRTHFVFHCKNVILGNENLNNNDNLMKILLECINNDKFHKENMYELVEELIKYVKKYFFYT